MLGIHTIARLLNSNPKLLIVQNPSIVLTALVAILKPIFGYKLVVDAHNEALHPFIHTHALFNWLSRRLIKVSDLTIVTNRYLANDVVTMGGTPFVLPDRVPNLPHHSIRQLSSNFNIVLVATFEKDEPVDAIFSAVAAFSEKLTLYVTGSEDKLDAELRGSLPCAVAAGAHGLSCPGH